MIFIIIVAYLFTWGILFLTFNHALLKYKAFLREGKNLEFRDPKDGKFTIGHFIEYVCRRFHIWGDGWAFVTILSAGFPPILVISCLIWGCMKLVEKISNINIES